MDGGAQGFDQSLCHRSAHALVRHLLRASDHGPDHLRVSGHHREFGQVQTERNAKPCRRRSLRSTYFGCGRILLHVCALPSAGDPPALEVLDGLLEANEFLLGSGEVRGSRI